MWKNAACISCPGRCSEPKSQYRAFLNQIDVVIIKTPIPVVVTLLAGFPAMAQTNEPAVEDFKPSTLNQPGQQFPQVNSQRYARFRIVAPQAQSVWVSLGGRVRVLSPSTKARTVSGRVSPR